MQSAAHWAKGVAQLASTASGLKPSSASVTVAMGVRGSASVRLFES